jgi:hypothetical protein
LTRSSLLSVFLIVAIGLVLTKTYWLWTTGPWEMPNPGKAKSPIFVEGSKGAANPPAIVGTETIVSKNIFDPERGAGFTREAEANSQAFQRIRSMVLLGTAILGNNRFAVLQDGATSSGAPAVPGQSAATMRIKLGDTVEGFRLSEVSEKRVVFARGASTVEVPLDYFRKTDVAQPRRPVAGAVGPTPAQTGAVGPAPAQTGAVGPAPAPRVVTPGPTNVPGQRVPRAIPALPRRDRESSKED